MSHLHTAAHRPPGHLRHPPQEEEDAAEYVAGLASDLFFYEPQDVLSGQYLFEDWDPALVCEGGTAWRLVFNHVATAAVPLLRLQASELLHGMTPDAVRLDLCTRNYEAVSAAVLSGMPTAAAGTEPWFNFEYVEAQLPEELRQRCALQ